MSATTERRAWIFGTTAPALVFLLVIAYLPIAYAVMLSFFKKTAFNPAMSWVGLANYRYILEEPELWNAFWRSVVFSVGAVGLQLKWGLVSALLLDRAFRAFLDVTLPNLRTTLIVIALLRGIWMFNKFDSIWLVTHGGPLKHTETLPLYAYRLAFEEFDFGLAAAACSVMFVVLLVGAVVYFKLFDPTKEIEVGR